MKAILVFILSCFAVASSSKCDTTAPLPKASPMNNLKKITGVWYLTVSSNDSISTRFICGTISRVNMNSESEEFTALITKYYSKDDSRSFRIYERVTKDGHIESTKIDDREIQVLAFDPYGRPNIKALEQDYDISLHAKENSLISDGIHYFAYVNCTPQGWAVWVYTPQKVLTTEQLLHVRNELVKHEIHTQLTIAMCGNIHPEI